MTGTVFLVVLLAAVLHAGWNASVRGAKDRSAGMTAVVIGQGLTGLAVIPFAPIPAAEAWPWLLLGVVLHLGYNVFLILAYRLGDLTQVYPIARGASPLLVALATSVAFGVSFTPLEMAALFMISLGIASISLVRQGDGTFQGKAAVLALITGMFIASYSVVDGHGARLGGTAIGFYAWLAFLDMLLFILGARVFRPGLIGRSWALRQHMVLGGTASFTAYVMVVWAFTQAPIALVTALREASVIFAALFGILWFGERPMARRLIAAGVVAVGIILLSLS